MSLGGAALALWKVTEAEEVSQLGCVNSGNKLQRQKEGLWREVQEFSLGEAATPHCSPGCKSLGTLSLGEIKQRYMHEGSRGVWVCSRESALH